MKQRQPGLHKPQGLRPVKDQAVRKLPVRKPAARKLDKGLAQAADHAAPVALAARVQVPTPGMRRCRCG